VASAEKFARLPYASVAVITLVARGVQADASGVLVGPGELPTIKAVTYSTAKWAWVASQARQAWGPGVDIVRVSVGRHRETATLQLNDRAMIERTFAEAAEIPGWEGGSVMKGRVSRWGGSLPQYRVGHRELVARLRADVARTRGLAVAGAALDGIGIPACLGSARLAVKMLAADLGQGRDGMIENEDQLEESER
jgi:oxygen-dependent protoporphyrinogen oxidase